MLRSLFLRFRRNTPPEKDGKKEFSHHCWESTIFKKLRSTSRRERREAVALIDNSQYRLLAKLVANSRFRNVRKLAFKKIRKNPKALFLVFSRSEFVSKKYGKKALKCLEKLVDKIKEPEALGSIAVHGYDENNMLKAVRKIRDAGTLADVVLLSKEERVRNEAFEKIEKNPDALFYIVTKDEMEDELMRERAAECLADMVDELDDPEILEAIAMNSSRMQKRRRAVEKLGEFVAAGLALDDDEYFLGAKEALNNVIQWSKCRDTKDYAMEMWPEEVSWDYTCGEGFLSASENSIHDLENIIPRHEPDPDDEGPGGKVIPLFSRKR